MKNTDILYILRTENRWNKNNELKYSLRSVEECCKIRNVFVVGGCPNWINRRRVIHIKADDPHGNKLLNAIHKISLACRDKRLSENFILMNDDFFFLEPVSRIELFHKGTLEDAIRKHKTKGGYYYKALRMTKKMIERDGGKIPIDYEVHYPIMFNKKEFLRMVSKQPIGVPYLFRSRYYNSKNIKAKKRKDVKAYNFNDFLKLRNGDFISTDDNVAEYEIFKEWCKNRFGTKSKYEICFDTGYIATIDFELNGKTYKQGQIVREKLTKKQIKVFHIKKVLCQI